jgi:hypothetical protein
VLIEGNRRVVTKRDELLSPSLFTFRSHFVYDGIFQKLDDLLAKPGWNVTVAVDINDAREQRSRAIEVSLECLGRKNSRTQTRLANSGVDVLQRGLLPL